MSPKYDITAIEARVQQLDNALQCSADEIFNQVVEEFGITHAEAIAKELGCRCPYGLLGWLEADAEPDTELADLFAETDRIMSLYD